MQITYFVKLVTFLPQASAKAWSNSLVFSGSWPATILEGLTLNCLPTARATKMLKLINRSNDRI